ncbi:polysaccharide pyruvyl transferase family protein [Sphingobacterium sp. PU5-4]|uniref:Polysaccharide pyruvyl transferase family protein n=1 Tax=Sphingobacterium tenebrionis TaxID=3111775 RepID=A0ABU8I1T3_9SPHI
MSDLNFNVIGAYGETNYGDDLLMHVFENYFIKEFPKSKLNFEGERANYPKKLLKKGTYNKAQNTDWLIFGGGTQFFAFHSQNNLSFIEKVKIGIKNPQIVINKLKPKRKASKHIAFLGFGLGPFNDNFNAINNAKKAVSAANFVAVRDFVSWEYCREWGIDAVLGADVVFSSYFSLPENSDRNSKKKNKKHGYIVRDWDYEGTGQAYIKQLNDYLLTTSNDDKVIILAPLKDKNWIKAIPQEKLLIWDPNKFTIEQFLEKLDEFDGFISARYHGAIIAALLNKPVICIEIEPKLRILADQIKEFQLWEKPFVVEKLKKMVDSFDYSIDYSASLMERKRLADSMLANFKLELYAK